jgi:hypothetical protein
LVPARWSRSRLPGWVEFDGKHLIAPDSAALSRYITPALEEQKMLPRVRAEVSAIKNKLVPLLNSSSLGEVCLAMKE